nr:MAG TPA: Protein of unknown function (DUF3450) [Caudoviricetes sp.]
MTTDNIIDLLIIACSGLLVWSIAATLTILSERKELTKLHKSKDALRESMSNTNYYLHQQLERVKGENEALRTQNHQLRMKQQKQDN